MESAITVITINKDRNCHRDRLLEGLARNTREHECIVVEIGSTAPAIDIGSVRYVPLAAEGLPLARARNTGRQHATGDILVFLDVDCIPSADLVSALADAVATAGGFACCKVVYLPDKSVEDAWTEPELRRRGQVERHLISRRTLKPFRAAAMEQWRQAGGCAA